MVNNTKRRSLKGVVLIMVVTVMLMLIILLLATMAVVSTAQNRYYTKFEENQAYYTARSALDVYVDNLYTDDKYLAYDNTGIRQYSYTDGGATQTVDMKQGLAMQLDTYRIKAHAATMDEYNAMTDKTQYSTDHWVNATNDIFDSGTPEKTYYEVPDLPYIEYEIELPEVKDGSTAYGGIVDTDSTGKQIAKLRVEVLARTYNGHSTAYPASPSTAEVDADKDSIAAGERYKDQVYVKVTSNVEFQGIEGLASIVFCSPETENQFTSALTATGAFTSTNHGLIIDGFSTPDPAAFNNDLNLVGRSYTGGAMSGSGSGNGFEMSAGECVYIKELETYNNFYPVSLSNVANPKDVPVIFVDGNCTFYNQVNWGGKSGGTLDNRVDLVVNGDLTIGGDFNVNGNVTVKGDLYLDCNNINLPTDCKIIVGGDIHVTRPANVRGTLKNISIFCNGDFDVSSPADMGMDATIPSSFFTNLYMKAGKKFAGITLQSFSSQLKIGTGTDDAGHVSELSCFDSDAFDDLDITINDSAEKGAQIFIPKLDAANTGVERSHGDTDYARYVPTQNSMYSKYWRRDSTAPYSYQTYTDPVTTELKHYYVTAEEMAGATKAERDVGDYSHALNFASPPGSATALPTSGTLTASGDYIMSPGSYNLTINCAGDVNIYVKQGGEFSGSGITVADSTKVNFYFPQSQFYTMWMPIWNEEAKNAITTTKELRFGTKDKDPNALSTPKIKYFVGAGSTLHLYNGGSVLVGYIYGPDAKLSQNTGGYPFSGGTYYYNGEQVVAATDGTSTGGGLCETPVVIGAAVCKDVAMDNQSMFGYIKDDESPSHGEPFWSGKEAYYYTMS